MHFFLIWHIDNQGKASKLHIQTTSIYIFLIPTKIQFWTLYQDVDNMKVFKVPNKKTKLVWKVLKVPNTRTRPICSQINSRPKLLLILNHFVHWLVMHVFVISACAQVRCCILLYVNYTCHFSYLFKFVQCM